MAKLQNLRVVDIFANSSLVGYREPAFKFHHLLGIHLPIRMNEDLQYVEPERNRETLKDLARGVIRLIGITLDSYRELGIFDDALIAVIADHGLWTPVSEVRIPQHILEKHGEDQPVDTDQLLHWKGTLLPLVLIKRAGAEGEMSTNDAPVALADIPKTLVTEMGFDAGSFPGESMFEVQQDQKRTRVVFYSTTAENPAYSAPYRSTMTEFEVDGFSWHDKAWRKTGRIYPPGG